MHTPTRSSKVAHTGSTPLAGVPAIRPGRNAALAAERPALAEPNGAPHRAVWLTVRRAQPLVGSAIDPWRKAVLDHLRLFDLTAVVSADRALLLPVIGTGRAIRAEILVELKAWFEGQPGVLGVETINQATGLAGWDLAAAQSAEARTQPIPGHRLHPTAAQRPRARARPVRRAQGTRLRRE